MKLCVLIIFLIFPWISKVGDWALSWTDGNEKLQIAFVMMIFPLIMNALQYYIIDSLIKGKATEHERLPSEDPDDGRGGYDDDSTISRAAHDRGSAGQDYASGIDNEIGGQDSNDDAETQVKRQSRARTNKAEYDPQVDGDVRTVTGSSSNPSVRDPPTELLPKE